MPNLNNPYFEGHQDATHRSKYSPRSQTEIRNKLTYSLGYLMGLLPKKQE